MYSIAVKLMEQNKHFKAIHRIEDVNELFEEFKPGTANYNKRTLKHIFDFLESIGSPIIDVKEVM